MEKTNNIFRDLKASEIDVRVATCKKNGVSLLLYKDARCDMNILDETVGPMNWERDHVLINNSLFCRVGINRNWNALELQPDWVWKQDVGTESYTEKEKGQASDAFKRACFNWGIGRELYTAPFIWIPSNSGKVTMDEKNGKYSTYDRFKVTQIVIKNKVIVALAIKNTSLNKMAFAADNRKEGV